jgi:polysaccharide biosynthesis PFTS motif protein
MNRAMLYALGKPGSPVVYYFPPEWRQFIRNQGFKVAPLRTVLLWKTFVGIMLMYGVFKIAKIIVNSIKAVCNRSTEQIGRYVYFDGLTPGHLPQPCRDGRSHDIITWYMQWDGRDSNIDALCHGVIGAERRAVNGVPVVPVSTPMPPLKSFGMLSRFMAWGVKATLIATWDFLCGHWWHALLLKEAAVAVMVRMQNPELLAKHYLFHESGHVYRPLWTYEAERRGARITLYFYSASCETIAWTAAPTPILPGYQVMTWPHYIVWNEIQADFVRRAVGDTAKTSIVGSIWFRCSMNEMPAFSGIGVAVFDVTPHRSSSYQTLGAPFEYRVPEFCIQFLHDIQHVTKDAGCMMLWKRKRDIGTLAHPRYRFFAKRLSKFENVIEVDPDISPNRVIEASTIVISAPFTTTAVIARELGKPSCYYDPTGLIRKGDRAAYGIEVLTGPEELETWLKTQLKMAC